MSVDLWFCFITDGCGVDGLINQQVVLLICFLSIKHTSVAVVYLSMNRLYQVGAVKFETVSDSIFSLNTFC